MATIYTNSQGIQVYDYNGQTYNAKTGQIVTSTATSAPPVSTPTPTTATVTRTSNAAQSTPAPVASTPAPTGPTYLQSLQQALQTAQASPNPNYSYISSLQSAISSAQANGTANTPINATTNPVNTPANSTATPTTATTSGGGVAYNPSWSTYGITPTNWSQMSATQQGVVAAALTSAANLYAGNASNVTLSSALAAAATDPTITAQFADALKLDKAAFTQNIQQLQTATTTSNQNLQTQFENDRRNLASASAAAGQAYSGFRGRAQTQLAQNESGIVTSSRSQLQQNLQDLTTKFESKYGTGASTAATASFVDPYASSNISLSGQSAPTTPANTTLSGTLAGGVTGSEPIQKQQAIDTLAGQYVTEGQLPAVKPAT